jgi:hypothetical protein
MTSTSHAEIQVPRADPRRRATPMRRRGTRRARRWQGGCRAVAADPVEGRAGIGYPPTGWVQALGVRGAAWGTGDTSP